MEEIDLRNPRSSPTVARRLFGAEMERLRGDRRQPAAADALGWALAKLKYIESGARPLPPSDLERVFDVYDVAEPERRSLSELCEEANARGWWEAYGDEDLSKALKRYTGYEQGAARIRSFEPLLFHGLLQTEPYAEVVLRSVGVTPKPAEQVGKMLEVRRRRWEILNGPDAVELWAVIDEAALWRRIGTRDVMRDQLDHVADIAEQHENVTVRVIPFDAGPHAGLGGAFSLLQFDWPDDAGLVYVEPSRAAFLESRRDVYLYSQLFDRLLGVASSPIESVQILRDASRRFGARKART